MCGESAQGHDRSVMKHFQNFMVLNPETVPFLDQNSEQLKETFAKIGNYFFDLGVKRCSYQSTMNYISALKSVTINSILNQEVFTEGIDR